MNGSKTRGRRGAQTRPGTMDEEEGRADSPGGQAGDESSPPTGPDRLLLFADASQKKGREEEEEERQLEHWVTCSLAGESFALPVSQIKEVLRAGHITRVPHAPFPVRGVTNMRGYVLPVVDLGLRLGLGPVELGPQRRVLVVTSKGRLLGLLVDNVKQVVELDRLAVEPPPEDVMTEHSYYLLGVYHLQDELLILLDPDLVLQIRETGEIPASS